MRSCWTGEPGSPALEPLTAETSITAPVDQAKAPENRAGTAEAMSSTVAILPRVMDRSAERTTSSARIMPSPKTCVHRAADQRVHPDAALGQLDSLVAHEHLQGTFGGGIGRQSGYDAAGDRGAQVEHATAVTQEGEKRWVRKNGAVRSTRTNRSNCCSVVSV